MLTFAEIQYTLPMVYVLDYGRAQDLANQRAVRRKFRQAVRYRQKSWQIEDVVVHGVGIPLKS